MNSHFLEHSPVPLRSRVLHSCASSPCNPIHAGWVRTSLPNFPYANALRPNPRQPSPPLCHAGYTTIPKILPALVNDREIWGLWEMQSSNLEQKGEMLFDPSVSSPQPLLTRPSHSFPSCPLRGGAWLFPTLLPTKRGKKHNLSSRLPDSCPGCPNWCSWVPPKACVRRAGHHYRNDCRSSSDKKKRAKSKEALFA